MSLRSIFLSLFFLSLPHLTTSLPTIGVTFSTNSTHRSPPPDSVVKAVDSLKLTAVRLDNSDPIIIRAFAYTNITLLLTIPNFMVAPIAANRSAALRWLYTHVVPFYPRTIITTISVGNDFIEAFPDLAAALLPAMRNVYTALRNLGLHQISVSTTLSFVSIMATPFPPSAARFQDPVSQTVINPLLQFLRDTNSSFLINIYPYNLYRLNAEIPIGYALFQTHTFNFRDDVVTGVRYRNLFDSMVDAVISASAVAGHGNVPLIVTETGWPSFGTDYGEVEANPDYAEMYLKGLTEHLNSGFGTPLKREGVMETYIYQLFDWDEELGAQPVRQWGLLYPNMTKKYDVVFSNSAGIREQRGFLWIAWCLGVTVLTMLWFSILLPGLACSYYFLWIVLIDSEAVALWILETTVEWQLASSSGAEALAFKQQEGISFFGRTPLLTFPSIVFWHPESLPAQELVEKPFFETMAKALKPGGVICNMAESMWLHTHLIQDMISICREVFKGSVHYAWGSVLTYPSGVIGFLLCSTEGPPVDFKNPIEKLEGAVKHKKDLKFYNSEMHSAAFALPSFLRREVKALVDSPNPAKY